MPHDLTITRNAELMVAGVDAETDRGIDFVDAWLPQEDAEYTVVDSGRLVIHEALLPELREAARRAGLTTTTEEQ